MKVGITGAGGFGEGTQPLGSGIRQVAKPSPKNNKEVTIDRIWCSRPGPGHRVTC